MPVGVQEWRFHGAVVMVCATLRTRSPHSLLLILFVCLTLVSGIAALPSAWLQDEATSLRPMAHDLPLNALITDPAIRMEKQAQSYRPSMRKLERGARLSAGTGVPPPRLRTPVRQVFQNLPRRQFHPAHIL